VVDSIDFVVVQLTMLVLIGHFPVHLVVVLLDWFQHVVMNLMGHLDELVDLRKMNKDENPGCFHNDHFVQFGQRLGHFVEL